MTLKGIDVSKHQGTIDWSKASSKIDFAILRAGYGKVLSQKDPQFENNYKGCKDNNVPVGVYWYSYAKTTADAEQEAKICLEVIKDKQFEYPIFFDIEENDILALGQEQVSAITEAFLKKIKAAGYYPGIYSSKSALETYISKSLRNNYDVWVAHVNVVNTTYSGDYTMWQYSWKGSVSGIAGEVDMDYCYKDYPTEIKKKGMNGYTKSAATTTVKQTYRIRKSWEDKSSQIGAYTILENAKKACKVGYTVYDNDGNAVYTNKGTETTTTTTTTTKSSSTPDIYYKVYSGGKWYSEIKNYNTTNSMGYAGVEKKAIRGLAVKASKGTIKYRVHVKGGGWLSWIAKYDANNWVNGCAGIKTKDADAIQVSLEGVTGYTVKYRVSTVGSTDYLPWVTGYNNTNSNGYAGIYGKSIDKVQMEITKK